MSVWILAEGECAGMVVGDGMGGECWIEAFIRRSVCVCCFARDVRRYIAGRCCWSRVHCLAGLLIDSPTCGPPVRFPDRGKDRLGT